MKSKCECFHKSLLGLNEGLAIRILPFKWIAKNTILLRLKFTQYKVQNHSKYRVTLKMLMCDINERVGVVIRNKDFLDKEDR